jgi:hypothetical protein
VNLQKRKQLEIGIRKKIKQKMTYLDSGETFRSRQKFQGGANLQKENSQKKVKKKKGKRK